MKLIQGEYIKNKRYVNRLLNDTYFEFNFSYTEENVAFKEINRFNDESKQLTRFKNRYTGDVVIDITEWVDKPGNTYFTAFMYFILERMLDYSCSKIIFTSEKECSKEFIAELEDYFMDIEIIDLGVKKKEACQQNIGFAVDIVNNQEGKRCLSQNIVNM